MPALVSISYFCLMLLRMLDESKPRQSNIKDTQILDINVILYVLLFIFSYMRRVLNTFRWTDHHNLLGDTCVPRIYWIVTRWFEIMRLTRTWALWLYHIKTPYSWKQYFLLGEIKISVLKRTEWDNLWREILTLHIENIV